MYEKIPKSKIVKMAIVKTDCKKNLKQVVAEQKCNYAINGGLYDMKTRKVNPIPLRIDGKTIATSKFGYWVLAWNTGSDICMVHSSEMGKWKYAIACSSFLKDGANTNFIYTSAQGGCRGRTGFGYDASNVHLCVTTDSNNPMTPNKLRDTMKANGCKNAEMLDCGGSSQIYANGSYLYTGRPVSYWICVWTDEVAKPTNQKVEEDVPYDSPTRTLRIGYRGEDVQWLQWKLNKNNFDCGKVDGIFGRGTKSAVMRFQKEKGLVVDGIVGINTRSKLYDSPTRILKVGCKGEDVQWLQWKLNKAGYVLSPIDGIFGYGTRSVVMKFQKANGLVADGIVGANTKAKLS